MLSLLIIIQKNVIFKMPKHCAHSKLNRFGLVKVQQPQKQENRDTIFIMTNQKTNALQ